MDIIQAAPTSPGVYVDIDIDVYHGGAGISKSGLDSVNNSPFMYWAKHINPDRPSQKDKAGQLEGSLAHCAVLEPLEFSKRYVVGPDVNKNTKEWKSFVEQYDGTGITIIKPDQYDTAWKQADSVMKLKPVAEMFAKGKSELSAYWKDPFNGELCRARPDWTHNASESEVILLDLKTFSDARSIEFARQCASKRYHVQDAFYTDGFTFASKKSVLGFIFIAVETEYPYRARCMMIDEEGKQQGRMDYRNNLETYAACRKADVWPDNTDDIAQISLPRWALTKDGE
jgi:exodeoxyribonuclease VIII